MAVMMHILRQYRRQNDLTLEQLAKKVGSTKGYLCLIEQGRTPSIPMLGKISAVTGIPREDLMPPLPKMDMPDGSA